MKRVKWLGVSERNEIINGHLHKKSRQRWKIFQVILLFRRRLSMMKFTLNQTRCCWLQIARCCDLFISNKLLHYIQYLVLTNFSTEFSMFVAFHEIVTNPKKYIKIVQISAQWRPFPKKSNWTFLLKCIQQRRAKEVNYQRTGIAIYHPASFFANHSCWT